MPGLAVSIRPCRSISFLVLLGAAPAALGEDLFQVYRDAQRYDAVYAAARHTLAAGRERLPQGRALLLPSIGLTGNATRQRVDTDTNEPTNPFTGTGGSGRRDPNSAGYTLTFTQPLFRWANWLQYVQADYQVAQAEAAFGQASQDLAVRVAVAYFDALTAQDTLELVRAQKVAIAEQLAQAKRNFEVGTATITDTHEAQARFDLINAQEIATQNDLENKRRALQLLTGKEYTDIRPLRSDVKLPAPDPNDMAAWVELAEKQNFAVLIQQAGAEVAALEARRARANYLPTLDIVATHNLNRQLHSPSETSRADVTTTSLSVQLAMPLFQGGNIDSREREAAAIALRAKEDLENARRSAALATRQAYLAVISGIAQVGALEQALVSSQSALDSNRLGYEVGVRINIDVLNAQQQLFSTRRELAIARYGTISNHLRLKAAAGALREEDLEEVNRVLVR
jgi:outer membrane protein